MNLFTIGFAQKTASEFFKKISDNKIDLLIDIRLNNKSQLAGFTKGEDLEYFLKTICNCDYQHLLEFAPTKEILDDYRNKKISWIGYEDRFLPLIEDRKCVIGFNERFKNYNNICLLCSEPKANMCHRRLVAEAIAKHNDGVVIKHI